MFMLHRLATNGRARCLQAALVLNPFVLGLKGTVIISNIGTLELIGSADLDFLWADDRRVSEKAQSFNHIRTADSQPFPNKVV